jgi:hypothetical protein
MATDNSTAIPLCIEPDRRCDQAVARMFAKAFPALRLTRFAAFRTSSGYTHSHHIVVVSGTAGDLVSSRIINADMLPPGRKRRAFHRFGEDFASTSLSLERVRGGTIEATHYIRDDESLSADHPLHMFHPRHWPIGDHPSELRSYFERDRADARSFLAAVVAGLPDHLYMSDHGYSVHAADQDRMQQVVREFGEQLLKAFDNARVVSDRAPKLKLVANSAEVAHVN